MGRGIRCARWAIVVIAAGILISANSAVDAQALPAGSPPADDAARAQSRAAGSQTGWFPSGTLFPALTADLKEPRYYASFRRTRFDGEAPPTLEDNGTVWAALLALGTEFGVWGTRDERGNGLQFGITAGVFTQFDMSSRSPTMLNADYLVGPQFTYRRGSVGVRSRIIHQSSHLGDGLLRRAHEAGETLEESGPSMEWVDALLFLDGRHVRLYGTTRYVINSITRLAPWQAAVGAELRSAPIRWGRIETQPFAATHIEALEARGWGTTRSAVAGIAFNQSGASRGMRVSAVYQNGFTPFGKFFTAVRVKSYGVQLEFMP